MGVLSSLPSYLDIPQRSSVCSYMIPEQLFKRHHLYPVAFFKTRHMCKHWAFCEQRWEEGWVTLGCVLVYTVISVVCRKGRSTQDLCLARQPEWSLHNAVPIPVWAKCPWTEPFASLAISAPEKASYLLAFRKLRTHTLTPSLSHLPTYHASEFSFGRLPWGLLLQQALDGGRWIRPMLSCSRAR